MASTVQTNWSSLSVIFFGQIDKAAQTKISKRLVSHTLKNGFRLLSAQKGHVNKRLDGWFYLSSVTRSVLESVLEPAEKELLDRLQWMQDESEIMYHVVVRGADPAFVPPSWTGNTGAGGRIVTHRFFSQRELFIEKIQEQLIDSLCEEGKEHDRPEDIETAMNDLSFVENHLRTLFTTGNQAEAKYFARVSNLTFDVPGDPHKRYLVDILIQNNHPLRLRYILQNYSPGAAIVQEQPWYCLVEPSAKRGPFDNTAFHSATWHGRTECLRELLAWAEEHNHNITNLRNKEAVKDGVTVARHTCLEMARTQENWACYNLLAPAFGVPLSENNENKSDREKRHAILRQPRVELVIANAEDHEFNTRKSTINKRTELQLHVVELSPTGEDGSGGGDTDENSQQENTSRLCSAQEILEAVKTVVREFDRPPCKFDTRPQAHRQGHLIRITEVTITDDFTKEMAHEILYECRHFDLLSFWSVKFHTDKSNVNFLDAIVTVLDKRTNDLPLRINTGCDVSELVPKEDDADLHEEASTLVMRYAEEHAGRQGFLGVRRGGLSIAHLNRLPGNIRAAVEANCISHVPQRFIWRMKRLPADRRSSEQVHWESRMHFLVLARDCKSFWNRDHELFQEYPRDPREVLDPHVVTFVEATLKAWLSSLPIQKYTGEESMWTTWARELWSHPNSPSGSHQDEIDESEVREVATVLRENFDLCFETLLRMDNPLDYSLTRLYGSKKPVRSLSALLGAATSPGGSLCEKKEAFMSPKHDTNSNQEETCFAKRLEKLVPKVLHSSLPRFMKRLRDQKGDDHHTNEKTSENFERQAGNRWGAGSGYRNRRVEQRDNGSKQYDEFPKHFRSREEKWPGRGSSTNAYVPPQRRSSLITKD